MDTDLFERKTGLRAPIDTLSRAFDAYRNANYPPEPADTQGHLEQIKVFLNRAKELRARLFARTLLEGNDCITMSTLGVLLARRRGVPCRVAVPLHPLKQGHAVIQYESDGQARTFRMAGKKDYHRARAIRTHELHLRLSLSKPLLRMGKRAKRRIRRAGK
jgi:hypothetical protein